MQTATLTRRPTDAAEELETLRYRFMEMEDRYRKQALAMACALVSLVDLRDAYTGSHSSRVAGYAREMGLRMGLPDAQLDNVVMAALLHDIGKIGVPDHVLLEPGRLTEEGFGDTRKHDGLGMVAVKEVADVQ